MYNDLQALNMGSTGENLVLASKNNQIWKAPWFTTHFWKEIVLMVATVSRHDVEWFDIEGWVYLAKSLASEALTPPLQKKTTGSRNKI